MLKHVFALCEPWLCASCEGISRNPLRARHIRRWDNPGPLGQFGETLRRTFEGKPHGRRLQHRNRKNLSGNPEGEIDAPGDLFSGVGKAKTAFAHPVYIHEGECRAIAANVRAIWVQQRLAKRKPAPQASRTASGDANVLVPNGGIFADKRGEKLDAFGGVEIDDLDAIFPEPIDAPAEIA